MNKPRIIVVLLALISISTVTAQSYNYKICKIEPSVFNMTINGYDVNSPTHNLDKLRAIINDSSTTGGTIEENSTDENITLKRGDNSFTVIASPVQQKTAPDISLRFKITTSDYNINGLKVGDGMREVKETIEQFCPDRSNQRFYTAYGNTVLYIYMDADYRTVQWMELVDRGE